MRERRHRAMILLAMFALLCTAPLAQNRRVWAFDLRAAGGRTSLNLQAAALRFAFTIEQNRPIPDTALRLAR